MATTSETWAEPPISLTNAGGVLLTDGSFKYTNGDGEHAGEEFYDAAEPRVAEPRVAEPRVAEPREVDFGKKSEFPIYWFQFIA